MDFYLLLGVTIVVAAFLTKRIRSRPQHPRLTELEPIFKPFNPQPVPNAMDTCSPINEDLLMTEPLTPGSPMSEVSSEDLLMSEVDPDYIKNK